MTRHNTIMNHDSWYLQIIIEIAKFVTWYMQIIIEIAKFITILLGLRHMLFIGRGGWGWGFRWIGGCISYGTYCIKLQHHSDGIVVAMAPWEPSQYAIRHVIVRSRQNTKPRDLRFGFSYHWDLTRVLEPVPPRRLSNFSLVWQNWHRFLT